MTHIIKKASIALMIVVFIASMVLSAMILPSKVYADNTLQRHLLSAAQNLYRHL